MSKQSLGAHVIRELRRDDRPRVATILASAGNFRPDEGAVALELFDLGISAEGEEPLDPDYRWLGAVAGEDLAGVACYGPTPATDGTFDLYWIALAASYQNRGIGRALLGRVEAEVTAHGGRLLVVETSSASTYEAPRAFYTARGYAVQAKICDFYGPGDDRLILVRTIR